LNLIELLLQQHELLLLLLLLLLVVVVVVVVVVLTYKILRILKNVIVGHTAIHPVNSESWLNYFQNTWSIKSEMLTEYKCKNDFPISTVVEELDIGLKN
jgi:hypothetical protein